MAASVQIELLGPQQVDRHNRGSQDWGKVEDRPQPQRWRKPQEQRGLQPKQVIDIGDRDTAYCRLLSNMCKL